MSKRMFLLLLVVILLAIGVGFTTIESGSMQGDMSNFEDQLTSNNGISSSINNSSFLSAIALKIQSIIDLVLDAILGFIKKIMGMFN